jgi:hypothetical protein
MELADGINPCMIMTYYVNREKGILEAVPSRIVAARTGGDIRIEADIAHFSDYTIGVDNGWDGSGLDGFMDYMHSGNVSV